MKVTQSFRVPHPAEEVTAALCSAGFNVDRERDREGVVSTEHVVTRDDEARLDFELRTVEHKRTRTGGIDRSGTARSTTRSSLDRKAGLLRWSYHGEAGDLIRLEGLYRIVAEGETATRLTHEVTVEVRVPLIGGAIARLISKGFDKPESYYRGILERHLA